MARDPFSWADEYGKTQQQIAAQENNDAQNSLMRMFVTEAGRQQPYNELPVDLAKQNNQYDRQLQNSLALAGAKAAMRPAMAPAKIANVLQQTAKAYSIDPDIMITLADIESSFNPNAKNPSGAAGLLQFMPSTAQQYGLTNPYDVQQSAVAGAKLIRDNASYLEKNGIPVNAGTIYLAHQQGAGGAVKLLRNPDAPAEAVVGRKAVLQNGGRPGMTAGQFAAMWTNKAERLYKQRQALRSRNQQPNATQVLGQELKIDLNNAGGLDDEEDAG